MTHPMCSICSMRPLATTADRSRATCGTCADTLGVIPLPRPRREPTPCIKCNGTKLIRAVPRELGTEPNGVLKPSPMTVTYTLQKHGQHAVPVDSRLGLGLLEMYICRGCGYVEWYCADPEHIPIHPAYMTEDIDVAPASSEPYR